MARTAGEFGSVLATDISRSLQELENNDWSEPADAPTPLVQKCLALRRVPLAQLSAENCRMLLGQQVGPRWVLPVALGFLAENLMESGTMYDGALLKNALKLPADFWLAQPELWWEVNEIMESLELLKNSIEELAPDVEFFQNSAGRLSGLIAARRCLVLALI